MSTDHGWGDPDPGPGPVWHAAMSLLTIAGIGVIALLAIVLVAPR